MSKEQTLSPELDPGPVPLGVRVRNVLAVPARLLGVLLIPDRVMPTMVSHRRSLAAFLIVLIAGLTSAYVVGTRIDTTSSVLHQEAKMQKEKGADYEGKSDRELKEQIVKERTIEQVKVGLFAGLARPLLIVLVTILLFLLGRYVGSRPSFGGAFAAAANGALPIAVKSVVVAVMAWPSKILTPDDVDALNRVAVIGPSGNPFMKFLTVDAFLLWSVLLLVFGLAAAGQMSRRRSFITIFICFALYQLLTGGAAAGAQGPGPISPPGGTR